MFNNVYIHTNIYILILVYNRFQLQYFALTLLIYLYTCIYIYFFKYSPKYTLIHRNRLFENCSFNILNIATLHNLVNKLLENTHKGHTNYLTKI